MLYRCSVRKTMQGGREVCAHGQESDKREGAQMSHTDQIRIVLPILPLAQ